MKPSDSTAILARIAELKSLVETGDWLAAAIERACPIDLNKEVIQALISWQDERASIAKNLNPDDND